MIHGLNERQGQSEYQVLMTQSFLRLESTNQGSKFFLLLHRRLPRVPLEMHARGHFWCFLAITGPRDIKPCPALSWQRFNSFQGMSDLF